MSPSPLLPNHRGFRADMIYIMATRLLHRLVLVALALMITAARGDGGVADTQQAELTRRRAQLRESDFDGRIQLALWCKDRQLWTPMVELAREALELHPESRAAFALLMIYDQNVALPAEPKLEATLRTQFADVFRHPFKTRATPHFLLVYDTTDAFATSRGAQLESAYQAFMFYLSMKQVRPELLPRRLVVVLLAKRDDFLAYARLADDADLAWAGGYYSQRTNFAAFYDETCSPGGASLNAAVSRERDKIKELSTQIQHAQARGQTGLVNSLTFERNHLEARIRRVQAEAGVQSNLANGSKTLHEAVHQLAFNTGIQTRLVEYPFWLSEGLACMFEAPDARGRVGPAMVNLGRAGMLKAAVAEKRFVPLETLVAERPGSDTDAAKLGVWYAESWGLMHYLYRHHRPGLERLLKTYHGLPPGRAIPGRQRRQMFVDAFGDDLAGLERKFLGYIESMPGKAK